MNLPSYSTWIKLCPWQSLTFDSHWMELHFKIRNQWSVLWENVRNVKNWIDMFKCWLFEPNYAIIFYLESSAFLRANDNYSLREISKGENKTTTTNMPDSLLEVKAVPVTCVNMQRPIQQITSCPLMFHILLSREKRIIELSRKNWEVQRRQKCRRVWNARLSMYGSH